MTEMVWRAECDEPLARAAYSRWVVDFVTAISASIWKLTKPQLDSKRRNYVAHSIVVLLSWRSRRAENGRGSGEFIRKPKSDKTSRFNDLRKRSWEICQIAS